MPKVDLSLNTGQRRSDRGRQPLRATGANRRRSIWLVIGFIIFFAWVGFGGDLAFGLLTADAGPGAYHHVVPFIGIFTTLAAAGICWYAWREGAERVLWATGAWEIIEPATPEQKQLVNVVEEMAIASGLPRPRIWIVPDQIPTRSPPAGTRSTASIAVTEGLLAALNRDELQGVVAHEMAHVRNLDMRLMTLLAGMVGAIALMSDGMGRMMRGGSRVGSGWRSQRQAARQGQSAWPGPAGALAPHPDHRAGRLQAAGDVGEPEAGVPGRRHRGRSSPGTRWRWRRRWRSWRPTGATRSITHGAAHLCIVDPAERKVSDRAGFLGDVFASHPPIRERVSRLRGMAYQ